MTKILGIDYGLRRVGVAVTDEDGRVAFPKAVLPNDRTLISTLAEMLEASAIHEVVIGESINNQGEENSITKNIKKFAADLEHTSNVTIHFEPEFYSSQEVRTHTGRTAEVDAEAAAVILNSFLTKRHGTYH